MEAAFALLAGAFVATAVYLLLSRSLLRTLLGVAVLGNGINLLILVAGRLTRRAPPIVPVGQATPAGYFANPLPQALILTAIVIWTAAIILAVLGWWLPAVLAALCATAVASTLTYRLVRRRAGAD